MNSKPKILFIGNFLSRTRGTKSVTENLADSKLSAYFDLKLSSDKETRFVRLLDMLVALLSFRGKVVHIDVFSGQAFRITQVISLIAKLLQKTLVFTLHGGALPEYSDQFPSRVRSVFSRAATIQTPSKYLQQYYNNKGFQINYLPNSVDLSNFPYSRSTVKQYSILWIRAFDSIYQPEMAIQVLNLVKQKFPTASLTMVGPDKGKLQEIQLAIAKMKLQDAVEIVGAVQNDQLFRYYQSHQVYINTTKFESFGVALVEAASCGIPIVSTSVGEVPLIWEDRKNILLSDVDDVKSMATNIELIFSDRTTADHISQNARENVKQFNAAIIVERWQELFDYYTS